ncbi:DNA-binding LacI/PurR family transcriptional regulator [Spinactinospora alkalitolerans]|uniref:DNA-binding LacI/PurR family transcriptional regulator n=1 Tax=Spinactinospora alkalitolerans TaxID=687207 RepID=A0A852TT49_9ACTN|nr:LacI family DNA-binding transcriptional regulator [Spinactinospora alkalitolerans]NYE46032.1 DNA-binding LacI/PurR family transcriptional regulator [Spinactinospora alkalitolerans]
MAGLEEVARIAKVSASTVSRAMSRPDMVSPRTLERVRAAAEQVGFRANPAARALTTGRTGFLAMLVPGLDNPFYAGSIAGAQAMAKETGRWLIIAVTDGSPEREAAALGELEGQVDGFVLLMPVGTAAELKKVHDRRPVVVVNRKVPGLTSYTVDTPGGLARVYDRLVELGHTDVAYLAGPPGSWMDRRRQQTLSDHASRPDLRIRVLGPMPPEFTEGAAAADAVLASGCTAALAYNSSVLLGLVFELSRRGVRVPEDISVAAADDMAFADLPGAPLTAVRVPVAELGRRAVSALADIIEATPETPRPPSRTLPTTVHLTGSLAAPRRE